MKTLLLLLILLSPVIIALLGYSKAGSQRKKNVAFKAAILSYSLIFLSSLFSLCYLIIVSQDSFVEASTAFRAISILGYLEFDLLLDRISTTMLTLVSFVGLIVIRFSKQYLDGDTRQSSFLQWLTVTLSSVLLLVSSNNLGMYFCCWLVVSFSLHRLLLFSSERKNAVACAQKKFITSRIGDVLLFIAIVLIALEFNSLRFENIFALLSESPDVYRTGAIQISTVLIAIGALMKSAQLPFHSWLLDSLETPTPVSALMHAGIINAGGFLIVRMSPLFIESHLASSLMVLVGASTAVFSMSCMITQTTIKRRLAYSTIGQMGFMMMQCGLGLYALAMLHIVAHALYKAYAFLRAGSAMEQAEEKNYFPSAHHGSLSTVVSSSIVFACIIAVTVFALYSFKILSLSYLPIATVWICAILHLFISAAGTMKGDIKQLCVTTIPFGTLLVGMYLAFSMVFTGYLSSSVAHSWIDSLQGSLAVTLIVATCMTFTISFLFQIVAVPLLKTEKYEWLSIHLFNGFYIGVFADQLCRKIWPVKVTLKKERVL